MKSFIKITSWVALIWSLLGLAYTLSQAYDGSFYAILFGFVIISQSVCVLIALEKDNL